jgi:hypothetical protein
MPAFVASFRRVIMGNTEKTRFFFTGRALRISVTGTRAKKMRFRFQGCVSGFNYFLGPDPGFESGSRSMGKTKKKMKRKNVLSESSEN